MPIEVKRYKCTYCQKRVRAKKSDIVKHESICFYNPDVKSCSTCDHRTTDENGAWCEALKKEIFVRFQSVRNCPYWSQEIFEDEGGY